MSDSAKVRLVRCPKCENLLPELTDYSVYQCGGCGTVLRAISKNQEADTSSQKSDEDRDIGVSAQSVGSVQKVAVDSRDASDTEVKSSAEHLKCCDPTISEKNGVKENSEKFEVQSIVTPDKQIVNNDHNIKSDRDDLRKSMGREEGVLNSQISREEMRGLACKLDWQRRERGGMEGLQRNAERSSSDYPKEGPSNNRSDSFSGFGEMLGTHNDSDGANKVKYLEQDRAELLRKLDELKDQLSRSCDVVDKTREKIPTDMNPPNAYGVYDPTFLDGSSGPNRAPLQFFASGKHVAGSSYSNYCPDRFPYSNVREMGVSGYCPKMHNPNHVPGFGDPYGSQVLRQAPFQYPSPYQGQSHPYYAGKYVENNLDRLENYHHNASIHQPSCSCFHCHEKYRQVSGPAPTAYYNRRFPDAPNNPILYHHENDTPSGPCVNPLNVHDRQFRSRWPSDLNSDIGGFVGSRPRRTAFTGAGHHCHPIAGGAPFLTCYNCFELLILSKKVLHMAKNQQKICCGACSEVINFTIVDKKHIVSDQGKLKQHLDNSSSNMVVRDNTPHFHGPVKHAIANFYSDDYDNSGYDFQSIDNEPVLQSAGPGLSSLKQQELQSYSSSPSPSEDENSPEVLIAPREATDHFHQPIKASVSPPPPGSPLQTYFDYSSNNNHAANRFAKGNLSSRSDQEKVKPYKVTSRQNSLKEVSLATEMDVSFNESNTGVSQESGDACREKDHPKFNKGGESFFANIIKKSFRSNQIDDQGKGSVSVNGHIIPNRVVKKAEKLAGPVHSGKYWYDFRAGFWGVIGGPCLGIIPPFIEEFNYPMPENCAGGNTGVFVNGRELHQKDLDLLASRGLPSSRDRSYIVEISGRILDEDTGEELDCLGKLAPTVEKVKHGFGMKVTRGASQTS